jgi:hypothetical protein
MNLQCFLSESEFFINYYFFNGVQEGYAVYRI